MKNGVMWMREFENSSGNDLRREHWKLGRVHRDKLVSRVELTEKKVVIVLVCSVWS